MRFRHLTYLAFLMCMGSAFSQQLIKNIHIEIEYYEEKEISFGFFTASEDSYQLKMLAGSLKDLNFQLLFRMEDELTSEEKYNLIADITFFDLEISHKLGPFGLSWAIENLLGFNNPAFAIEGSRERDLGAIETLTFVHEADFRLTSTLSYRF